MKKSITLLILFITFSICSQNLTGEQLLEKAIQFHDPNNNWPTFQGTLNITMKSPNRSPRKSIIQINLPKQYFSVKATRDSITTNFIVDKEKYSFQLNGKNPTEEEQKKYNLNKDRANLYKNYYTYLYGLPMKLKDNGTIIHDKVELKNFKGKQYLVLKVTYPKDIGKDTWYFYFNPKTYAMEVYQFFKDESKKDGEYILLSDLETISGVIMPKNRAWYYNKNNGYLGTDFLTATKK
ncbi:MAG: hypothetical protein HWD82_09095 [Flavobacteriaceae bacterium]|nr:hypothetical protein [Flavobacteriaceae bacterium]